MKKLMLMCFLSMGMVLNVFGDIQAKFAEADKLREEKKLAEAEKIYAELVPQTQKFLNSRAVLGLADCLSRQQKHAEVVALLSERLKTEVSGAHFKAVMHNTLANAYLAQKKYDESIAECKKVMNMEGEGLASIKVVSLSIMAKNFAGQGKIDLAIKANEDVLKQNKDNLWIEASARFSLSDSYKKKGDKVKAKEQLDKVINSSETPKVLKDHAKNLLKGLE